MYNKFDAYYDPIIHYHWWDDLGEGYYLVWDDGAPVIVICNINILYVECNLGQALFPYFMDYLQ